MNSAMFYRMIIVGIVCSLTIPQVRADHTISDDLICNGSMSIGLDSVNGYSFGNDTLVLRETNTRIRFYDTSQSASFPTVDWSLVANDSSNGGDNYFALYDHSSGKYPFRVDAGAPAHSLYIANSGEVGLGTDDPKANLHIVDGTDPTIRLEQDGSSGWTAQTWDMRASSSGFSLINVTSGNKTPFYIDSGCDDNTFSLKDNKVGIGNRSPKATMHVYRSGEKASLLIGEDYISDSGEANLHVEGTAFVAGTLRVGSSRKRKKDITSLQLMEARETLTALEPVRFTYKTEKESQLGFIAEDVPASVATSSRSSVRPMDFVAVLTRVVQDHQERTGRLEKTISEQQALIDTLSEKLADYEKSEAVPQ